MLDFADADLDADAWRTITELGALVRSSRPASDLPQQLREADTVVVQLGVTVDRALLDLAPKLRHVVVFGTSLGRIDLAACAARDVEVRNVAGWCTDSVAELTIALVLDHLRALPLERARGASGDLGETRALGRELRDLRIGVVGMGAIGARVSAILEHGFGADVRHWSRTARPEHTAQALPLDELLARSDVLTVHLALTEETRGLLDASRIARMRRGALLVHLSPLELLDLDAAVARIREGTLHLATDHGDELDPPALATVRALEGCVLYPPIGYATERARAARVSGLLSHLRDAPR